MAEGPIYQGYIRPEMQANNEYYSWFRICHVLLLEDPKGFRKVLLEVGGQVTLDILNPFRAICQENFFLCWLLESFWPTETQRSWRLNLNSELRGNILPVFLHLVKNDWNLTIVAECWQMDLVVNVKGSRESLTLLFWPLLGSNYLFKELNHATL